jgi:DNA helicase-2/ATP-dependent DNA helicase PcrA
MPDKIFSRFDPRPAQKQILMYRQGTMGVSAVPGSGKTWTLSLLAAEIINAGLIDPGQEILIVTLVNSAVDNFSNRISSFLESFNRIPSLGYRVRTLHGLSHDIVKERPDLVGLDTNFTIVDDNESQRIRSDAIYNWLKLNKDLISDYLQPDLNNEKIVSLYQKDIPNLFDQIALQFIKTCKNHLYTPSSISSQLESITNHSPLIKFGSDIYLNYQRSLEYRGAVDFDDLIYLAYKILQLDESLLHRLQNKWPYVLEDEAQDSSLIQQKILELLSKSAERGNWVRVGDPNQAIYESFTTADPRLLVTFSDKADHKHLLPNSGRSTQTIIDLANQLVSWTSKNHPIKKIRSALIPNYIQPTPQGDSQPNPEVASGTVHLHLDSLSPDDELSVISTSVAKWVRNNPDQTVAILAPRNDRGKKISAKLRSTHKIEPFEILNTTLATRKTTGALVMVLASLLDPGSPEKLSMAYKAWSRDLQSNSSAWEQVEIEANLIKGINRTETFISPGPDEDWLATLIDQDDEVVNRLFEFSRYILRWQKASLLPIDQLLLTIAFDIFNSADELSLSQKLSVYIKGLSQSHPDWDMPVLVDELKSLARNERRSFIGGENIQFNPEDHKGKVVVTTAHKAKGLEWDRVYIMSANNYNFPSGQDDDKYISEKWFIRDHLNLPAETLAQLNAIISSGRIDYSEGEATLEARYEYIRERLRLFYVAITRAKKDLVITWNTGRYNNLSPAAALVFLETNNKSDKKGS